MTGFGDVLAIKNAETFTFTTIAKALQNMPYQKENHLNGVTICTIK